MYRDDLAALAARCDALAIEITCKSRELDAARAQLEEARARARLPVLDNIRVASPCAADWSKMTGDDRVRFCGDCRQHVYNLSALSRDEAEALIEQQQGRLCVRYYEHSDGTILTSDCAVGTPRSRSGWAFAAGATALLATGAAALDRPATMGQASGQLEQIRVEKIAHEWYWRWAIETDQECPDSLLEVARAVKATADDLLDAWGSPYQFLCGDVMPAGATGIAVYSFGADGIPNTRDDLRSWAPRRRAIEGAGGRPP